jgi:GTPase KRas protein
MLRVKREKPIFILVGNMSDKTNEREVSEGEGQALAQSFGCHFMEASAKTAHNVELLFSNLIRALQARQTMQQMKAGVALNPQRRLDDRKKHRTCFIL